MARTLIGAMVSRSPATPIVNRLVSQPIASEEARMVLDGAPAGWHYGASRCHYTFLDDQWNGTTSNHPGINDTITRISGTSTADFENNRLPVISMKTPGGVASEWVNVTNGTYNSLLDARADEIIVWQDAHRNLGKWGASFAFFPHHEPNGQDEWDVFGGSVSATGAAWIAMTQYIYERWEARGVTIWTGLSDWTTYTEGLILGVNLVDGHAGNSDNALSKNYFWGPANGGPGPGNTWMDEHCILFTTDPYPVVSFLPFSDLVEVGPGGASTNTIRSWGAAKRIYQTSQNRPFMEGILETGIKRRSQYTVIGGAWTDTGLAATEANWMYHLHDYCRDDWPDLNLLCYWDDQATGIYDLDGTPEKWAATIATFTDPTTFASALDQLPTVASSSKVLILD